MIFVAPILFHNDRPDHKANMYGCVEENHQIIWLNGFYCVSELPIYGMFEYDQQTKTTTYLCANTHHFAQLLSSSGIHELCINCWLTAHKVTAHCHFIVLFDVSSHIHFSRRIQKKIARIKNKTEDYNNRTKRRIRKQIQINKKK